MTLYFKQYNSTGQYWIVPTYVVTHGEVFKGILHLSDLDMSVLGTSQIPDNMSKYASAYSTTLHWLASFVTKATPGSLTGAYWGKIAVHWRIPSSTKWFCKSHRTSWHI